MKPSWIATASVRVGVVLALSVGMALAQPRTAGEDVRVASRVDRTLLLDAAWAGARAVAVGERGAVFLSDDEGLSWRSVRAPTQKTLTSVTFVDAQNGFATGHGNTLLRTRDGGVSWAPAESHPPGQEALLGVHMLDGQHGFAFGAYGVLLESHDGGNHWVRRTPFEDDFDGHLYGMASVPGALVLVGEQGAIGVSRDGGERWVRQASPYNGSYFGVVAATDGSLLAYGMRGKVFRSTSQGARWEAVDTGVGSALMAGTAAADGSVVLVGNEGVVLRSRDNGRHFEAFTMPQRRALSKALSGKKGLLLFFGEQGFLFGASPTSVVKP